VPFSLLHDEERIGPGKGGEHISLLGTGVEDAHVGHL